MKKYRLFYLIGIFLVGLVSYALVVDKAARSLGYYNNSSFLIFNFLLVINVLILFLKKMDTTLVKTLFVGLTVFLFLINSFVIKDNRKNIKLRSGEISYEDYIEVHTKMLSN